jgi:hypothetical protein
MKFVLAAILLVSGVAHAEVEFSKHGTNNVTTAADGASVFGQEALNLIAVLNIKPVNLQGYLNYNLCLDGPFPCTGAFLTCSVENTRDVTSQLKSAGCYFGNVPKPSKK